MKPVTLIESLNLREVTSVNMNDAIALQVMDSFADSAPVIGRPGEYLMADAVIRNVECPVMQFRHYVLQKGGKTEPKDLYIAVSPEVEKYLGVPLACLYQETRELSARVESKKRSIERLASEKNEIQGEIERFWSLPWWQRAWKAIFNSKREEP